MDSSLPAEDVECLERLLSAPESAEFLNLFREATAGLVPEDQRTSTLTKLIDLVVILIEQLKKKTAIFLILWLDYGTNLFPKTIQYFDIFWSVLPTLAKLAEASGGEHPLVLWTLCKTADTSNPVVKTAMGKGWLVDVNGLAHEACKAYMASHLAVPLASMPADVVSFVAKLSMGNPLYIRETLDQLLNEGHISVEVLEAEEDEEEAAVAEEPKDEKFEGDEKPAGEEEQGAKEDKEKAAEQAMEKAKEKAVAKEPTTKVHQHGDPNEIEIASWSHTAMVGDTMCLLESLDPLEAAILKMSTVFSSSFSLADLAACTCSRWSGSNRFDYLRLFRAVQELEARGILDKLPPCKKEEKDIQPSKIKTIGNASQTFGQLPFKTSSTEKPSTEARELQMFEMRNVLIRKVGGSMLLEAQKRKVKRQALIDRSLQRDLPRRMEELKNKRNEPHIPWYYENILSRN